jgi:putative transposase
MILARHAPADLVAIAMGSTPNERARVYQQRLNAGIAPDDTQQLRVYASQERTLGDERFQRMVETTLGRPAVCRPRGRPPRTSSQEDI